MPARQRAEVQSVALPELDSPLFAESVRLSEGQLGYERGGGAAAGGQGCVEQAGAYGGQLAPQVLGEGQALHRLELPSRGLRAADIRLTARRHRLAGVPAPLGS